MNLMKTNRLQRPPGNLDTADPREAHEYLNQPEVIQQELANTRRLTELSRKSVQEYLERQRMAEEAEKKGEKIGRIKMLMDLFSKGIVNLNIVMSLIKQELDIKTDVPYAEVEKKVQEIFPDFHLPAHS